MPGFAYFIIILVIVLLGTFQIQKLTGGNWVS